MESFANYLRCAPAEIANGTDTINVYLSSCSSRTEARENARWLGCVSHTCFFPEGSASGSGDGVLSRAALRHLSNNATSSSCGPTKPGTHQLASRLASKLPREAVATIEFVITGARLHGVDSAEDFVRALQQHTELSRDAVKVLGRSFASALSACACASEDYHPRKEQKGEEPDGEGEGAAEGGGAVSRTQQMPQRIGRLLKVDWKLALGLRSNHAYALHQPLVTLVFHTEDGDGKTRASPLELGIPEFRALAKKIRDARESLEMA